MTDVSRFCFSNRSFLIVTICGFLGLVLCGSTVVKTFIRAQAKDRLNLVSNVLKTRLSIYDRNGVALAATTASADIYVHPERLQDKIGIARQLANYLAMDFESVYQVVSRRTKYAVLTRGYDLEFANHIVRQINMPTVVNMHKTAHRKYHGYKSLDPLVGKVGIDGIGLYGIERFWDRLLSSPAGNSLGLWLTLDSEIQAIVDKVASEGLVEHSAKAVMLLVARASDGQILAYGQVESTNNPAPKLLLTEFAFEPGSTFKPFSIALALEKSNTKPFDVLFCEQGSYKFGRHRIGDVKPYGNLTVTEVLAKSSNICTGKLGLRVEKQTFLSELKKLGFGDRVFNFPAESRGIIFSPRSFREIDQFVTSFGQGIAVTPIQMVKAFTAFLNNGRVVRPTLLMSHSGESKTVMSAKTANAVKEMLIYAVQHGTGRGAQVNGLRIGGKTGTAQKVQPGKGGYVDGKYISSFLGFVDLGNDAVVIYSIVDEPGNGLYLGGQVAAPLFRRVVEEMLSQGLLEKYSRPSEVIVLRKDDQLKSAS